jgi:hypothetical protein
MLLSVLGISLKPSKVLFQASLRSQAILRHFCPVGNSPASGPHVVSPGFLTKWLTVLPSRSIVGPGIGGCLGDRARPARCCSGDAYDQRPEGAVSHPRRRQSPHTSASRKALMVSGVWLIPLAPADQHLVGGGLEGEAEPEEPVEGGVRGAPAVEPEHELVQVGLEVLLAQPRWAGASPTTLGSCVTSLRRA